MKNKPLLPTLKEKKRYLAFEIIVKNAQFDSGKVNAEISSSRFMGDLEKGAAGISFVREKFHGNKGLIRVNHDYVDKLRMSLSLIRKIDNHETIVRSIGCSGVLKKAAQCIG